MIRFISVVLTLNFAGLAAQASTSAPSPFLSFSSSEAAELQKKLASLTPQEFLKQLRDKPSPDPRTAAYRWSPFAANQPPLWLGPHTAPVAADTFRLLDQRRAAELLPMLWKLDDKIFPEERLLFAAACFKALPEEQKHTAFARKLDGELKALIETSSPWGDRDSSNREVLMGRAVGALAGLWQGTEEERQWILQQMKNPKLDLDVRSAIINQLAVILTPQAEENDQGVEEDSANGTLRRRQMTLPRSDRERLLKLWGGHDWVGKNLIPLAQSSDQPSEVRFSAILALQRILGREERVKTLLLMIAESADSRSWVRARAIDVLTGLWGRDEVLKSLLLGMVQSPDESAVVRRSSIFKLAHLWKEDVLVRDSLAAVAALPDDHPPVQRAALDALAQMGMNEWLQQYLLKTATQAGAGGSLRQKAMSLLGSSSELDPAAKTKLLAMAANGQELPLLRVAVVRCLGRSSKKDEQVKARLTQLLQSPQEDGNVRIACFDALGLVWQRENNEWVKDLLMPLAGSDEKCVVLRTRILWSMPQMFHRQPQVQEMFKRLAISPDEPESIHAVVIRASFNADWRKEDWFKELLIASLEDRGQPVKVRQDVIDSLTQIWRGEPWVVDLLLPVVSSPAENPQVRQWAIMKLGSAVRFDQRLQDLLLAIVTDSKEVPLVRRRAIMTRKLDVTEAKLLIKIAGSSDEELSVREEAIDVLGRAWEPLSWQERGDFLTSLAGTAEKGERIRYKAAYQLALIREGMGFQ